MPSRIVAISVSLALGAALAVPAASATADPLVAAPVLAATLPVDECKLASPLPLFNEGFALSTDAAASTGTLTAQVVYAEMPAHPVGAEGDQWIEKMRHDVETAVSSLEAMSGGRVDVVVREHPDWVTMPHDASSYPESGDLAWGHAEMSAFVTDAVVAADPAIDYTGVDVVWVFFPSAYPLASRAQATNSLAIAADGGTIARAVTLPFETDGVLAGTIVHETGHTFSLPDLYDTGDALGHSRYIGKWDPMGDADGEEFGTTVEFMGWHLWRLGWIDDEQVTCLDPTSRVDVTLDALTRHGSSVIAVVPTSDHRAVVIESRKAERFNAGIPRPGLLVYVVWTDSGSGGVFVGPRDGTEFPIDPEGFANSTLVVGDQYTDPVAGFTVTVIASSDASDTVRIESAEEPTEPPVDPAAGPAPPGQEANPAGGAPETLPPTGPASVIAVTLAITLLLAGTLTLTIAHRRRPSPQPRETLR